MISSDSVYKSLIIICVHTIWSFDSCMVIMVDVAMVNHKILYMYSQTCIISLPEIWIDKTAGLWCQVQIIVKMSTPMLSYYIGLITHV